MDMTQKETTVRDVRVSVHSVQYDYRESLSDRIREMRRRAEELLDSLTDGGDAEDGADEDLYDDSACGEAGEPFTMVTEGRLRTKGDLCELSYLESDAEGLENTKTTLVFSRKRPNIVTLTRTGMMKMTLSFETGRHHIGSYHIGALQALFSDKREGLPIASYAREVKNDLFTDGELLLDYIIEVRGMDTQRTVFRLSLSDLPLAPTGFSVKAEEEGGTE